MTIEQNILTQIIDVYPNFVECIDGHIGEKITDLELELDDDRYIEIEVTRCSACGVPC